MSVRAAFAAALVACLIALVMLGLLIVTAQVAHRRRRRARAARTERWRALVLAWMSGGDSGAVPLNGPERRAVVEIAGDLLSKVRGSDREALADILVAHGVDDAARRGVNSRWSTVRLRSVVMLDLLARAADVEVLIAALRDRDRQVRDVAVRALGRIGSPLAIDALLRRRRSRPLAAHTVALAIHRIGPPAIAPLTSRVSSGDPRTRRVAAELLGLLRAGEAELELIGMLDDDDPAAMAAAATALGRLGRPTAVELLMRRLERLMSGRDPDIDRCVALVGALGQIGDRRALALLLEASARPGRISAAATTALGSLGQGRTWLADTPSSPSPPEGGTVLSAIPLAS